ncbi:MULTISPECIES: urease subunit beta [Bacillaceae]|uniref:Urease subunit beta n=1 Tax=Peribacillus huizhouensis TaxID=1501239 RepID=A0ABR6CLQ1_9BACI|nr:MULTISPECIES: urease subunit beta [Bacillaceae]MBA9025969.1 urease subunit beta [Peribacillus huizhouensis]
MIPGQYIVKEEDIIINEGKAINTISVINTGDRPVQIGSHFHFYEVNEALQFNREEAFGKRLNIPAGAAVRFEPGDEKEVELLSFAGEQRVYGFNNKVDGSVQGGCK